MKRLVVLAAVFAVLSAAMAFGGVQDFGKFTVDVPAGWTAAQDDETVGIVKNDNTAAVSITYDSLDGATLEEAVDAFLESLGGKNPGKAGDKVYTFTFTNDNGVESKCYISGDDKNYALIVVTGGENAADEISGILDSVQEK